MICLPSKSTHLLQPLDVGCFGILQTTYERNLSTWLQKNPLSVISKVTFLEILQETCKEVYTVDCVVGAWRAACCWPINRNLSPPNTTHINTGHALDSIHTLDTPAQICKLSHQVEDMMRLKLDTEDKGMVHELINLMMEKVTKHRDIVPQADTLKKLRSGKVRREKKRSRHVGEARVLTYKHVNEGLKKLAEQELQRLEKQRVVEEKKTAREILNQQWKVDLQQYNGVDLPSWHAACAEIDTAWAATKQLTGRRSGRKPPYPPRPKRPLKPKGHIGDLSEVADGGADGVDRGADSGGVDGGVVDDEEEDLVNSVRALEIAHFAEVSAYFSDRAILPYRTILL